MKQKSLLLVTIFTCLFGINSVWATTGKPYPQPTASSSVKSYLHKNIRAIQYFDRYTTLLEKAISLPVLTERSQLTNSSLTNNRPNGYSLMTPLLAITHGQTTDYYNLDNVGNGATIYFTIPDIANVANVTLYQSGENFHNWEDGTLTTDGGSTQAWGTVPSGVNWMEFFGDGYNPFNIVNGVDITVY